MADDDEEEAAVLTVGVWEVYLSEGRPYFFKNDGSETTQWDCPEELKGDPRVGSLLDEAGDGEEDEEEGGEEGEVSELRAGWGGEGMSGALGADSSLACGDDR